MIEITIPLNPVTKKNSLRAFYVRGRLKIVPSAAYEQYEDAARLYLARVKPEKPISYPVCVTCLFYMKTRRRVDLTNLLEAIDDVLVTCGILADDNCKIVVSHDGSRVLYDKASPRTEITITAMEGATMGL